MKPKTNRITLFPTLILLLIEVVLGYALNNLPISFFDSVESIIPYKWLLILFLLLFLAFILLLYFNFRNSESKNTNIRKTKAYKNKKAEFDEYVKSGKEYLKNLTEEEKEILRYFIDNQSRSQNLPAKSGIVNGLKNKYIIYRSSTLGNWGGHLGVYFDYNIQDWAWDYLNKNKYLLD